jgi:hypothetical protein
MHEHFSQDIRTADASVAIVTKQCYRQTDLFGTYTLKMEAA